MFQATSRLSIIALTLGLLLAMPIAASAELDPSGLGYTSGYTEDVESIGYVPGHRSYQDEQEANADFAALNRTREALLDELAADAGLTVAEIQFVEDNVFDLEVVFIPAGVPTIADEIMAMFGTDHVTVEMIEFYEQNVWY